MFRESIDETTLPPEAMEMLEAATRSTDEMRRRFTAIRSALSVPRSMDDAEPIDFADLIRTIWGELLEAHQVKEPRLAINGQASVESDRTLIGQLVTELLDNCIRFRKHDETLSVCCELAAEPDGIRVEIVDNGLGIDPDRIAHFMQPFHRGQHHDGLGLGLTRCGCIMRTVGGQLQIRSDGQSGTTVTLRFPK